ncbi:LacI family transcriptional regulator [bacterium]|nr:MAG: LacI family transcriptional regulator [bacterium]
MSNPPSKSVTLEDVAKAAGVHRRTAGDALQGTGRVALATREKVRRIARELQYEPNLVARALVTGKTGRISVLVGSLNELYNVLVVQHLSHALTQNGYEAVIIQAHDYMPSAQTLRSSFSDGMIVVGMHFVDRGVGLTGVTPGRSGKTILPFVVIDSQRPDYIDHISFDLGPATKEVLHSMLASGRKRIAYVNKQHLEPDAQEVRYRAYMDLMREAGIEPEIIVADEILTSEERIEHLKNYFQQHGAPGAIFCHNDQIAGFAYRALRSLGHEVPKDTLVAGCDGIDFISYFDTPLSTITVPWKEVSEMACQFLKQRIADSSIPVQEHVVEGQILVRESLGVQVC